MPVMDTGIASDAMRKDVGERESSTAIEMDCNDEPHEVFNLTNQDKSYFVTVKNDCDESLLIEEFGGDVISTVLPGRSRSVTIDLGPTEAFFVECCGDDSEEDSGCTVEVTPT